MLTRLSRKLDFCSAIYTLVLGDVHLQPKINALELSFKTYF